MMSNLIWSGRDVNVMPRTPRLFNRLPRMEEHDDRPKVKKPRAPKKAKEPEPHEWAVGDKFWVSKWNGKIGSKGCEMNCNMLLLANAGRALTVQFIGADQLVCENGWAWPMSQCKDFNVPR